MNTESKKWKYNSPEEEKLAEYIINLEKKALDKWKNGDTSGYAELWSKKSFTYFDGVVDKRVEDYQTIAEFLKKIEGNLKFVKCEFIDPRVQIGKDMAVLTYQLFAKTSTGLDIEYNCIEVFQKEDDGQWKVIHSTWSFIKPIEKDFSSFKNKVVV